jgi:hypothetical protein
VHQGSRRREKEKADVCVGSSEKTELTATHESPVTTANLAAGHV